MENIMAEMDESLNSLQKIFDDEIKDIFFFMEIIIIIIYIFLLILMSFLLKIIFKIFY